MYTKNATNTGGNYKLCFCLISLVTLFCDYMKLNYIPVYWGLFEHKIYMVKLGKYL